MSAVDELVITREASLAVEQHELASDGDDVAGRYVDHLPVHEHCIVVGFGSAKLSKPVASRGHESQLVRGRRHHL